MGPKPPREAWKAALKKKGQLASGKAAMELRERPEDAAALAPELVAALHRWITEAIRDGMGAGDESLHVHFDQHLSIIPAVAAAGEAVVPLLVADLRSDVTATRAGAGAVLAQMGPAAKAAIPDLEKVVASTDPSRVDHWYAVDALAEHRGLGDDLVPGLAAVLDWGVTTRERRHGREFNIVAEWRSQRQALTRWLALRAVARGGEAARRHVARLLPGVVAGMEGQAMGEQSGAIRVRRLSALLAMETLGSTDASVVAALAKARSQDGTAWMAERVAASLGVASLPAAPSELPSEADLDDLARIASGDDDHGDQDGWDDRCDAARDLAELGAPARRALPRLREALAAADQEASADWCDPRPVLLDTILALSEPAEAVAEIERRLESVSVELRIEALRGARHVGAAGAPLVARLDAVLRQSLAHPDRGDASGLAAAAAEGLGGIGRAARPAWESLVRLRSADLDSQEQALAALVRIDPPAAAAILAGAITDERAASGTRRLAAYELSRLGADAVAHLDAFAAGISGAEHADDRDERLAQDCLIAVARLGAPASTLLPLVEGLARHETPEREPATRWLAEVAAREIGEGRRALFTARRGRPPERWP